VSVKKVFESFVLDQNTVESPPIVHKVLRIWFLGTPFLLIVIDNSILC